MSVRFGTPEDFRKWRQWVLWRYVKRRATRSENAGDSASEKPTKVPFQVAKHGVRASTTDPSTWGMFEHAVRGLEEGRADGVGFVFGEDPFTGADLDGCRNPETGELAGWASAIVEELDSYTEVSPSGTGVHVIVRGDWKGDRNRKGSVEVYSTARFFAVTGERLPGVPHSPLPRQQQLDELYARLFPPQAPVVPAAAGPVVLDDDQELLERMCTARNGAAVERLWHGDWSAYSSQSEADMALVGHLAYWTAGDVVRIDRLFRMSGLMRRKWEERPDYRERTIAVALGQSS